MASSARIDEIKKKFDENPRRYFAPLANEFRKAGDLEQAILICEEFLPQQAGHMSGHIVYGQALFESGRLPESRTVFETALALDPENLIALRHLGDIARAQGETADARRWYDRVLEADPRNEEIQALIAELDGGAPAATAAASPPPLDMIDIDLPALDAVAPPVASAASDARASSPAVPPPLPVTGAGTDLAAGFSLDGLEHAATDTGATAASLPRAEGLETGEFEVPGETHARADGLEPLEFEAPSSAPARAEGLEATALPAPEPMAGEGDGGLLDLESSFELGAGSASTRESAVAPLAGLETTGPGHAAAADEPALPSLDLDEGLAVPPHGDILQATDARASGTVPPAGAGSPGEDPRMEPPAAMEAMPALALEPDAAGEDHAGTDDLPMMELSPSVIAAEAALTHEPVPAAGAAAIAPPFVTETMAELYLSQGFREQALGVYRQLSAAAPGDARLRDRLRALEQEGRGEGVAGDGPTVREIFFRLATRMPGQRAAADLPPDRDDFAALATPAVAAPALPAPDPVDRPSAPSPSGTPARGSGAVPSAAERAATAQGSATTTGSIDALFGTRPSSTSEDSAASALAQAFGSAVEPSIMSGRPARAASGELSLDSVFRDAPPRASRVSQSFSFDQFFSESAAAEGASPGAALSPTPARGTPTQGEPAERTADDVEQFNSWLQGLKPQ